MKRQWKTAAAILIASTVVLSGCGIAYNDYTNADEGIDKTVFYQNIGQINDAADPSVITVGDTYYLYGTNAMGSGDTSHIRGWKSKNLTDWQPLGAVFIPARDAWAVNSLWAPEVLEKDGTYYMYYSGYDNSRGQMGIGLAVSDSPAGPFHEIEGTFGGKEYSHTKRPFDFGFPAIDASPFIDEDGSVYLYVSKDQVRRESSIFGVELSDDMVTVTSEVSGPLVKPSQEWENADTLPRWNEAPFMLKKDGTYYLFYSANYYQNSLYAVGVATSSSPLSGFVKSETNPVLHASVDWPHVSGTGHCSVFPSADGSELWMAYHSHSDVEKGGAERKLNFDRIVFDGEELLVCGPSITPQPLPSGSSPYQNVAPLATVTSDGAEEGVELLTDGIVNYNVFRTEEYEYFADGKTKVTFTFDKEVSVVAVMVYDSCDYEYSASSVDLKIGKGGISKLVFNEANRYEDEYGFGIKIPGSAAIAQFEEISVTEITVTLQGDASYNEIVILGKEVAA